MAQKNDNKIFKDVQDNKDATFESGQHNWCATFKDVQDNRGATFKDWQYNRGAIFKYGQDNIDAIFEYIQYNWGATFKDRQENSGATFKKDMIIKDIILINQKTPESKLIAEFSKDREAEDCTLTEFIKWLQQKGVQRMNTKEAIKKLRELSRTTVDLKTAREICEGFGIELPKEVTNPVRTCICCKKVFTKSDRHKKIESTARLSEYIAKELGADYKSEEKWKKAQMTSGIDSYLDLTTEGCCEAIEKKIGQKGVE